MEFFKVSWCYVLRNTERLSKKAVSKRLGRRFDRLQAATARPVVPSVEERLGLRRALSAVEDLA